MSLRAFGLGLSAAAAFSAVAVLEAPAQAASIAGETLQFGGRAALNSVDVNSIATLSFNNFDLTPNEAINGSSVFAFGVPGTTFSINNLSLLRTGDSVWELSDGPVAWLSGLDNGVGFTVERFDLFRLGSGNFEASIIGFFTPSGLAGDGGLTSQGNLAFTGNPMVPGATFSGGVTAVPTPALLPGLVGLGVAAFRKRNGQDSSEQEA